MPKPTLTVEAVTERVDEIELNYKDPEAAHIMEDGLYEQILRVIAAGTNQYHAQKLCRAALQSKEIKFGRHCS